MRIAICEDDRMEQNELIEAIRAWDATRSAEVFCDGASLLEAARMTPPFSIAFLDIYLPGENGLAIAASLKEISPQTGVVFVTTSEEHAIEAFFLEALHYLVKPVRPEDVVEAFRRLTAMQAKRREVLSFTANRDSYTFYQDEICSLESFNHTVEISLADGRVMRVRIPLGELEQKLGPAFLRINRGILVNMEYIEQMSTDTCVMRSGARLAIAIRKHVAVHEAYNNFLFSKLSERRTETGEGIG